jgi:DNA-binding NtrC family response regulator
MISQFIAHVLIVDDDAGFLAAAADLAKIEGLQADTAASLGDARLKLRGGSYDLVLLDLELPDGNGMALFDEFDLAGQVKAAIITGNPSIESAVRSVHLPVVDYLLKPLDQGALRALFADTAKAKQQQLAQIQFRVGMTMDEVERQMLLKTLGHYNNHKPKAAQVLGISLKTVYNRLARFGYAEQMQETATLGG